MVTGRYEWVGFTSVNAVRAVREKFDEFGLDARAFAGLKVAAVGGVTAQALRDWGIVARPGARPASSPPRACSTTGPTSTTSSTRSTGSSCRAPTSPPTPSSRACRRWAGRSTTSPPTAPCGPHRRPRAVRDAIKGGAFDAVRLHVELDGAQPGRHRRQAAPVDRRRVHRAGHRQDGRGARPAGRRPRPRGDRSSALVDALADHGRSPRAGRARRPARPCCGPASSRPGGRRRAT